MYRNRGVDRFVALGRALVVVLLAGTAAVSAAGCGHKIGDSCMTGADCDPTSGTRTCDLSQPGGYCLIEGCDARSCPSDSVCIRFFPTPFFDPMQACTPATTGAPSSCAADEVCVTDGASANPTTGVCVRASLEKRDCVESCGSDGDCRGGYRCLASGTRGTLPLTLDPKSVPRYCAPVD